MCRLVAASFQHVYSKPKMAFYWSKFTCILTNYDYRGSYKSLNVQYFNYPNTTIDCSIREFDVHTRVVDKELCKQIVFKERYCH